MTYLLCVFLDIKRLQLFQPVQASLVLQFTAAANGAANVTVNGTITPTPSRKNSRNSWAGYSNYGGSAYSTMERNPRRSRLSTQGHYSRPHAVGIFLCSISHITNMKILSMQNQMT